jgi:N-acyl-L-homoserine lactone synthetase
MMHLITSDYYGNFVEEIAEMHRLRYRVFKERLDWTSRSAEIWRSTNSMHTIPST